MDQFSISHLQQLSGIKAHTIRIWEQRYGALEPGRSEGNTRYYDSHQLRRLLNIVSLLKDGYKISHVGPMKDEELAHLLSLKLEEKRLTEDKNEYYVSQLMAAAVSYDEAHFNAVYQQCIQKQGLKNTYTEVLYPLLNRMGLMWEIDSVSPAQEHFSSNLIKQKIFSAIESVPLANKSKRKWMLFLPENEFHEIGLLFANFLLREAGHQVVYLGSNVPLNTLEKAAQEIHPTDILLFFVHYLDHEEAAAYLKQVNTLFPKTNIHIASSKTLTEHIAKPRRINFIYSPEELIHTLNSKT